MIKIKTYPFIKEDRGVYRILFNNKWFYIGSSNSLRNRQSAWLTVFSQSDWGLSNKNMAKIKKNVKTIKFELLQKTTIEEDEKLIESEYVNKHLGSKWCLNKLPVRLPSNTKKSNYKPFLSPINSFRVFSPPSIK